MTSKKPDRRGPRTRQLLRDALINAIMEKGYDGVTVQDITDRANLGRATFYLHYKDKEELLLGSLRDMFDDLKGRFGKPTSESPLGMDQPVRVVPFQHAFQYRDLYRATLLSQQGTAAILNGIRDYLAMSIRERIEAVASDEQASIPIEMVAHFLAGAMLSLISWWLDKDTPYTAEQMADMFRELAVPTLSHVLGVSTLSGTKA